MTAPAVQPVPLRSPGDLPKTSWMGLLTWAIILVLLGASWQGADMRPLDLVRDSENMAKYAADFFPPNFSQWRFYLQEMIVTLQIALWGTVLAVVFAVPLGLLSAANVAPAWVRQPIRRLMDTARAINEMVFAMLFIVAVGLGPFAGVLALFVHTTGVLAKLFSEAVESIDAQPVEGIRATGANVLEEIVYGIIPQVLPLWISYSLYRFESNVRSASVVGMVGAGGVGVILWELIRAFQYAETCAVMIVIVLAVTVIDLISARIRTALV